MNLILGFLMGFGGGFVVALNLSLLIPPDPDYHASWDKVIIGCCIAVFGMLMARKLK